MNAFLISFRLSKTCKGDIFSFAISPEKKHVGSRKRKKDAQCVCLTLSWDDRSRKKSLGVVLFFASLARSPRTSLESSTPRSHSSLEDRERAFVRSVRQTGQAERIFPRRRKPTLQLSPRFSPLCASPVSKGDEERKVRAADLLIHSSILDTRGHVVVKRQP